MVLLFSGRKNKTEKEIISILCKYGANYISDKIVSSSNGSFTIVSEYKITDVNMQNGIAIFIDDSKRFENQELPYSILGICEENNINALNTFKQNGVSVISCGMNCKNTVTLSSSNSLSTLVTLQRVIFDNNGNEIEPGEYIIKLTNDYSPFSIMASATILILHGITPKIF